MSQKKLLLSYILNLSGLYIFVICSKEARLQFVNNPRSILLNLISFYRKENKTLLPSDEAEIHCASPYTVKVVHGLPEWLLNSKKDKSNPLSSIVLQYFTYQGVVWHLDADDEAMSIYFHKVIEIIKKTMGPGLDPNLAESLLICLKWMLECYAHLDEFGNCKGVLHCMRQILGLDLIFKSYWISAFKEGCVSVSLAENLRCDKFEPSPIRPGTLLFDEIKSTKTPLIDKYPKKLPRLKPKKLLPVNCEIDPKKIDTMTISDQDDENQWKTPPGPAKSQRVVKKAVTARKSVKNSDADNSVDLASLKINDADNSVFKTPSEKSQKACKNTKSTAKKSTVERSSTKSGSVRSQNENGDFKTPLGKSQNSIKSANSDVKRASRSSSRSRSQNRL